VLISVASNAQDIITTNKGNRINAIVREITPTLVRYNLYSDPDGKVIFLYKDMVSSILYQNGKIETFAVTDTEAGTQGEIEMPNLQNRERQSNTAIENSNSTHNRNLHANRSEKIKFISGKTGKSKFVWGAKAGLNFTSIGKPYLDGVDYKFNKKTGFHAGINLQYMFTSKIGVESGLILSFFGQDLTYDGHFNNGATYTDESSFKFHYLFLPISVLYKFKIGRNLYLYPSLGCQVEYRIDGSFQWTRNKEWIPGFEYQRIFDCDFIAGLTLQYSKFTFGLGYEEAPCIEGFAPFEGHVTNTKLSVGYFF
jgi:hypothetical protein